MTNKQLKQAISQLPQGERFARAYGAYKGVVIGDQKDDPFWYTIAEEGSIHLISKKADGFETRYKVHFEADDNVRIEQF